MGDYFYPGYYCHYAIAGRDDYELAEHHVSWWQIPDWYETEWCAIYYAEDEVYYYEYYYECGGYYDNNITCGDLYDLCYGLCEFASGNDYYECLDECGEAYR